MMHASASLKNVVSTAKSQKKKQAIKRFNNSDALLPNTTSNYNVGDGLKNFRSVLVSIADEQ